MSSSSEILNYISDNNLPCKVFLDGTNYSKLYISGGVFHWKNSIVAYPEFDFIQPISTYQPTIVSRGVVFDNTDRLYPVDDSLFSNSSSYTLIVLTATDVSELQQFLSVANNNTLAPDFVGYKYDDSKVIQDFSIRTLAGQQQTITVPDLASGISYFQCLALNHDVKFGITEYCLDNTNFYSFINTNKGYMSTLSPASFYLGNNKTANSPLLGKISYFLLFKPKITRAQLIYISTLLLNTLASITWQDVSIDIWNNLSNDDWNNIE